MSPSENFSGITGIILSLEKINDNYRFVIELYPNINGNLTNYKHVFISDYITLPRFEVNLLHLTSTNVNTINDYKLYFNNNELYLYNFLNSNLYSGNQKFLYWVGNENNQFINSENNYIEYTDNDITWEGSIKLNKTIIVKNNAKLIIKPGTQIYVEYHDTPIFIIITKTGAINAVGTQYSPIIFIVIQQNPYLEIGEVLFY